MATKKKKKKANHKTKAKKSAAKTKPPKKAAAAKKTAKKRSSKPKAAMRRKRSSGGNDDVRSVNYEPKGLGARAGGQSGDLQGLSDAAEAEAESVDELLEEGNAFEAEVVKGVEDAPDADEGEIRTREVPEEDVPEEYFGDDEEGGPSRRGKTAP
jgi:hypothetical protein